MAQWFERNVSTVRHRDDRLPGAIVGSAIEAIYLLCRTTCTRSCTWNIIDAGKNTDGEKPFRIDLPANEAVMRPSSRRPDLLVRCSSSSRSIRAPTALVSGLRRPLRAHHDGGRFLAQQRPKTRITIN